jgi:hypothetical protein
MAVMKGCKCNSASSEPCTWCQRPEPPEPEDNSEEIRLATPEPERCCDNCNPQFVYTLKVSGKLCCTGCEDASNWC